MKSAIHSNRTENINSCLTENVLYLHYKDQSINAMQRNNCCFFSQNFMKYTVTL